MLFIRISALAALLACSGLRLHGGDAPGFVEVQGGGFVHDGKPFTVAGLNCYYLMVYASESGLKSSVDEVFQKARSLGATVVRTWAFNDGAGQWNALQTGPGVYSEKVFAGLDYVVKRAGDAGLRLILPLVNNWDDYGGMKQYVDWSPGAASHDDFYTDADCKRWYKDHAAAVLNRINKLTGTAYRDEPAILAWELANEPRCSSRGAAALNAWIAEMAAHIKGIDSHHLLTTGSEGFYGPAGPDHNPASWMRNEGVDFKANHSDPRIDFASFHAYPDHWGISRSQAAAWIRNHAADARDIIGKPVVLGEFGKLQPVSVRDDYYRAFYDELIASQSPGLSSAGALFWILYHDAYQDYDGFGVYLPAAAHASTVSLIREKHAALARVQAGTPFRRGDADCDGALGIGDAIAILEYLLARGAPSCCLEAADVNADASIDLPDAVHALIFLYRGALPPPPPFPDCGTGTGAGPFLECGEYTRCGGI